MFVIIHGPLDADFLEKNLRGLASVLPNTQVILSIWQHDAEAVHNLLAGSKPKGGANIQVVTSEDVLNPGFFNINRQITLVRAGLACIDDEDELVIKLRMDQTVDFRRLIHILEQAANVHKQRLMTTNCYTRKDRLYHPSDMLLVGSKQMLCHYYPQALYPDTHLDCILAIRARVAEGQHLGFERYWPESRLFMNYLINLGEVLQHTQDDSERMLKKHVYLINSWDVGLKWKKFLRGRCCVLPYFFTRRPFDGGVLEQAENYLAQDLYGYQEARIKAIIYNRVARLYFKANTFTRNVSLRSLMTPTRMKACARFAAGIVPPLLHPVLGRLARRIYALQK